MLDVVGMGNLNIDFIATRGRLLGLDPNLITEFQNRFEAGAERLIDEIGVLNMLSQLGASPFDSFLGGSAFNTIQTLAALDTGLNLGFVGIAGKSRDDRLDFVHWFNTHNVDFRFGQKEDRLLSGTCISFMQEGERSLLIYPGANVQMAQHLSKNYKTILGYLSQSRILHVTSFFDNKTPSVLATLLRDAKRQNQMLKLSFDPGYKWLDELSASVREILSIADIVFLNQSEFRLLGLYRSGDDDRRLAHRVFTACGPVTALIIVKYSDNVCVHRRVRGRILQQTYRNEVLTPDEIEDATGAGDVFAGGFLSSLLIPGLDITQGVELGLRLVRSKLVQAGSNSFSSFPSLFDHYIDELAIAGS